MKTLTISEIAKHLNLEAQELDGDDGCFLSITGSDGENGVDYYIDDNQFVEWCDNNSLFANEPERRPAVEELARQWRAAQ